MLFRSRTGIVFRRRDRYGFKFKYSLCVNCGHVRTVNPLSKSATGTFYKSSDFRSLYYPSESPSEYVRRVGSSPETARRLFDYAVSRVGLPASVIEWGCSGGWNLLLFREAGSSVVGYDLDSTYVELGKELYNLNLITASSGMPFDSIKESADLIILNHVVEHVSDVTEFLANLRQCCSASTSVIVGLPLLETMRLWRWKNFFHIAHIHYFSSKTFQYCAEKSGFEIVHSSPKTGFFTLRLGTKSVQRARFGSIFTSVYHLTKGFFDPIGRMRKLVYRLICSLGLKEWYDEFATNLRSRS